MGHDISNEPQGCVFHWVLEQAMIRIFSCTVIYQLGVKTNLTVIIESVDNMWQHKNCYKPLEPTLNQWQSPSRVSMTNRLLVAQKALKETAKKVLFLFSIGACGLTEYCIYNSHDGFSNKPTAISAWLPLRFHNFQVHKALLTAYSWALETPHSGHAALLEEVRRERYTWTSYITPAVNTISKARHPCARHLN